MLELLDDEELAGFELDELAELAELDDAGLDEELLAGFDELLARVELDVLDETELLELLADDELVELVELSADVEELSVLSELVELLSALDVSVELETSELSSVVLDELSLLDELSGVDDAEDESSAPLRTAPEAPVSAGILLSAFSPQPDNSSAAVKIIAINPFLFTWLSSCGMICVIKQKARSKPRASKNAALAYCCDTDQSTVGHDKPSIHLWRSMLLWIY